MPTYEYKCELCEHQFEIFQGLKDPVLLKCPECAGTIERQIFPVMGRVKGQTLGSLAEKNTKRRGTSLQNETESKRLALKERTRERNAINRMTPAQQKKFIEGK